MVEQLQFDKMKFKLYNAQFRAVKTRHDQSFSKTWVD
jgi:hypothetical protein